VLNISPACVSLIGSQEQAIEDNIEISDLDVDELQLIVSSEGDTQRAAIEEQVAAALNAACLNDASTVDRHVDLLNSLGFDDLVFALQLIVRHAAAGAHPECCADLLLTLRTLRANTSEVARDGKRLFMCALLSACQAEYEHVLDLISQPASAHPEDNAGCASGDGHETMQQNFALFSFFGTLFVKGLLILKVVREIVNELLWPYSAYPSPAVVDCICKMARSMGSALCETKAGEVFLLKLLARLAELESLSGRQGVPTYSCQLQKIQSEVIVCD
jgi:hypothetical protein